MESSLQTDAAAHHGRRSRALVEVHIATLLLGFAGLFGKFVDAGPAMIVAGRTLFAAGTIFAVAMIWRLDLRLSGRRGWAQIVASGVLLALHWLAFFHAIQISNVAIGLLGFASFPLFVTLLEPIWFDERPGWVDWVAVAVVTLGLTLLAPSFDLSDDITRGLLWAVLSGFVYALFALLTRSLVRRNSRVSVTIYQQLVCFLVSLPLAVPDWQSLTPKNFALLAALGIICTALAQVLFLGSLKWLRAQTASVIICLEPVYGIALAWPLLGEIPTQRVLLGGALILIAVVGATLHSARRAAVVAAAQA